MTRKTLAGMLWLLVVCPLFAEPLPKDVQRQLSAYHVRFDHMSRSGSAGSMPLGNGDVSLNAWVDESRDLMFYLGKNDSWSEAGRLLKVGRVRVRLTPNPFTEDAEFSQTLSLVDGSIRIRCLSPVGTVNIRLWVEADAPLVRLEIEGNRAFSLEVMNDGMRREKVYMDREHFDRGDTFRGLWNAPFEVSEDPDRVLEDPDALVWLHHNTRSFYPEVLRRQQAASLLDRYEDPYLGLSFGAAVQGPGLAKADDRTLRSRVPTRKASFSVAVLSEKADVETFHSDVKALLERKADWKAHSAWWNAFWNRSWIFVSGDEEAEAVTRGWILQRFMMACQGRGSYPVKFNGGSLTFDYGDYDADYRRWGPGFWHQNQRLMYWPLLASGDDDLLQPWFDYYRRLLDFQRDVTALQFGHRGAYFPETMNPFGLYIQDDWGWDNPGSASETRWIRYHFSGGLEMLAMMIDAYHYSGNEALISGYIVPMAREVLRFFAEHWPRIGHTLRFIPANSIEQYWDCLNPSDYIAGIRYDIAELQRLPGIPAELSAEWEDLLAALPPLPLRDGKLLPAEEFGVGRNAENPELYAIFPFRLFGAESEVALRSYEARVFHDSNACWSQDNIQAALLGLSEDAARFTIKKAHTLEAFGVDFPGFWKAGGDWIPDLDNGGSLAMGLQYMLLSPDGDIRPACPDRWKVDFKLRARGGKIVRYKD